VLAETKRLVYVNSLPPDAEIVPEWEAFLAALGRLAAQERIGMLFERGFTNRVTSRHGSGTARTNSVLPTSGRLGHDDGRGRDAIEPR
jgi:hypothetical protein